MTANGPIEEGTSGVDNATRRIVMILGVQRSGTTALFQAFAAARGVIPCEESPQDDLYDEFFLRPEPAIRAAIRDRPGTILMKPVRESERRGPAGIAREFSRQAGYDLRMVWMYRDPVNVFDSYVRRGWTVPTEEAAREFAIQWRRRNLGAIEDAPALGPGFLILRYEDLSDDPTLVGQVAEAIGLATPGAYGTDKASGRHALDPKIRAVIDEVTRETRARLDGARFRGAARAADGVRRADSAVSALLHPLYRDLLATADEGATYRSWRARDAAPVRRLAPGWYVAHGYDAVATLLEGWRPSAGEEGPNASGEADSSVPEPGRSEAIRRHVLDRWVDLESLLRQTFDRELARVADGRPFLPFRVLKASVREFNLAWTRLDPATFERCILAAMLDSSPGRERVGGVRWTDLEDTLVGQGVTGELVRNGLLGRDEIPAFLVGTAMHLMLLPSVVGFAIESGHGADLLAGRLRDRPDEIPNLLAESLRLRPIWASLKRPCPREVIVDGTVIPAGSTVDLLVGAANRDPRRHADPDRLRLDRGGPPPLMPESPWGACLRLRERGPYGPVRLSLDATAIILERMITGFGPLRILRTGRGDHMLAPGGHCVSLAFEGCEAAFGR